MQRDHSADAIEELLAVADAAMAAVDHGGIAVHDDPIWRNEDAVALRFSALDDALRTLNLVAPQGGPNWPRALRTGLEDIQRAVTATVAAWGWHGLLDVPEARAAWHYHRIEDWHERVERPLMEAALAMQESARLASDLGEDVHDLAERGRALGYEPATTTNPRQSFRSAELRYRSDLRLGAIPRAADRHERDWKAVLRTESERIREFAGSYAAARGDGPRPDERWARSIANRLHLPSMPARPRQGPRRRGRPPAGRLGRSVEAAPFATTIRTSANPTDASR